MRQGLGKWIESLDDPDLGAGIFSWNETPEVLIFERGLKYSGESRYKGVFKDILSVERLDLRALMQAQKNPQEPVEFAVVDRDGRHVLRVPLFLYTTLAPMLDKIANNDDFE